MNKTQIYLRFFLFNFCLGLTLIVAQKICKSNHAFASSFLWIMLMVGLPLGAAIYSRSAEYIRSKLPFLFSISAAWLLLGSFLYGLFAFSVTPIVAAHFMPRLSEMIFKETIVGLALFGPLWLTFGALELELYSSLQTLPSRVQRLSYLCCVLGLVGALAVNVLVPSPSPSAIGATALLSGLVYGGFSFRRLASFKTSFKALSLICVLISGVVLGSNSYLRQPDKQPYFTGGERVHDEWNPFCRFSVLKLNSIYVGFYDAIMHWEVIIPSSTENRVPSRKDLAQISTTQGETFAHTTLTAIDRPIASLLPAGSSIALLGSGGFAQVEPFLESEPKVIYAVDIVPSLFETMSHLGLNYLQNSRVHFVVKDGFKFIADSKQTFDFIYLPITESIFKLTQHLFEPADHLFTQEAILAYREHLQPNGLIVIRKLSEFSTQGPLIQNYVKTLQSAGFYTLVNDMMGQNVIFASLDMNILERAKSLPGATLLKDISRSPETESGHILKQDRPFLASVLFNAETLRIAWVCVSVVCLLATILACRFVPLRVGAPALFCGANYTLILLATQLALFFTISNPLLASILGSIIFLAEVAASTIFAERKSVLAILSLGLAFAWWLGFAPLQLSLIMILGLWSGGFFPKLITWYSADLSVLLVLDGVGAAIGGALYLIIPTLWGISRFFIAIVCVFVATFLLVRKTSPNDVSDSATTAQVRSHKSVLFS